MNLAVISRRGVLYLSCALALPMLATIAQAQAVHSMPSIRPYGGVAPRPPATAGPAGRYDGAAGYGGAMSAMPEPLAGPPGPYTPLQIAQSFFWADANHDGELTRAEASHLFIKPYSLEEMDRNHDGIITRFEYEDAVH